MLTPSKKHKRKKQQERISLKNRNETFTKNMVDPPLADSEKIVYCHAIWIQRGLFFFIKTINKDGDEFKYLKKFSRVSDSKIRDAIFVGSQIWKLLKVATFNTKFSEAERGAGMAFESVLWDFLEDKKT
jgi:hypothetical protein